VSPRIENDWIIVNLFYKAGESSLLPTSLPGFIVAMIVNPTVAVISSPSCSYSTRLLSASKTELSRSRMLSLAKFISSIKSTPPHFIAVIRGPSFHSSRLPVVGFVAISSDDSAEDFVIGRMAPTKSETSV